MRKDDIKYKKSSKKPKVAKSPKPKKVKK